jgi:tripeptidyl-peptidase-1
MFFSNAYMLPSTIGANEGCGLTYAFNCTPAWDPVSGLGTPKFNMLHDIFMQLP